METPAQPAAPTPKEGALGKLICDSTPYHKMDMPDGWKSEVEWDAQYGQWSFRGENRRVAKMLRIPVTVTVKNEGTGRYETYRDWLLIGYEGGSGE